MSERKVINKYFPPDFDPSKIPRRRLKDKNNQQVVRLMAPFSMRCNSCGEYIYKGKKFNARKETVENEDYYGIRIFRFYIKCTLCSSEITFKTDPKNADYLAEHGAARNFESWRDDEAAHAEKSHVPDADEDDEEEAERKKEEEDAMKMLETSTENSKREMDILDALQDIRNRNARNERVGITLSGPLPPKVLTEEELLRKAEQEEDELLVASVFSRIPSASTSATSAIVDPKGKGKARAPLGDEYGSDSEGEDEAGADGEEAGAVAPGPETLLVKRKFAGEEDDSPTLAMLLGQKGLSTRPSSGAAGGAAGGAGFGFGGKVAASAGAGAGAGGATKVAGAGPLSGVAKKKAKVGGIPGLTAKKAAK